MVPAVSTSRFNIEISHQYGQLSAKNRFKPAHFNLTLCHSSQGSVSVVAELPLFACAWQRKPFPTFVTAKFNKHCLSVFITVYRCSSWKHNSFFFFMGTTTVIISTQSSPDCVYILVLELKENWNKNHIYFPCRGQNVLKTDNNMNHPF